MPGTSLASLVATVDQGIRPVHPPAIPPITITGVHVSELPDPGPFLDGGELLLTTGLALPSGRKECEVYVQRLMDARVAALGFGTGPVHDAIPPELSTACETAGLPLLEVPPPVRFQEISRAYWHRVSHDDQRPLRAALVSQAQLVRAALSERPTASLLRNLAQSVGGWAARHRADGAVSDVWPEAMRGGPEETRARIARLVGEGRHAAAALRVGEDEVVVQAIPRASGFLSVGSPARLSHAQRALLSTTSVLLSLLSIRREAGHESVCARSAMLARLVELGSIEPALRLAREQGFELRHGPMRVLALVRVPGGDVRAVVEQAWAWPGRVVGAAEEHRGWCLIPDDAGTERPGLDLAALRESLRALGSGGSALLGPAVAAERVAPLSAALLHDAEGLAPGTVRVIRPDGGPDGPAGPMLPGRAEAAAVLEPLLSYGRADLVPSLVAYLRHRGRWEAASHELGVHRNTLRHRIGRTAELLGADVDDADVSARLWLALRSLGHA